MTIDEMKRWVDNASMEDLLVKVRFEPPGSAWFDINKLDIYLLDKLRNLRKESPEKYKEASTKVGFPLDHMPSNVKKSWDRMNAI